LAKIKPQMMIPRKVSFRSRRGHLGAHRSGGAKLEVSLQFVRGNFDREEGVSIPDALANPAAHCGFGIRFCGSGTRRRLLGQLEMFNAPPTEALFPQMIA
jgi:hypothetical protein